MPPRRPTSSITLEGRSPADPSGTLESPKEAITSAAASGTVDRILLAPAAVAVVDVTEGLRIVACETYVVEGEYARGSVRAFHISNDGRRIAAAGESALFVAAVDGSSLRRLAVPPSAVLSLDLASGGAHLAAATEERTVWLGDQPGFSPRRLEGRVDKTVPVLLSSDGERLVGASEHGALLTWSVSSSSSSSPILALPRPTSSSPPNRSAAGA